MAHGRWTAVEARGVLKALKRSGVGLEVTCPRTTSVGDCGRNEVVGAGRVRGAASSRPATGFAGLELHASANTARHRLATRAAGCPANRGASQTMPLPRPGRPGSAVRTARRPAAACSTTKKL